MLLKKILFEKLQKTALNIHFKKSKTYIVIFTFEYFYF